MRKLFVFVSILTMMICSVSCAGSDNTAQNEGSEAVEQQAEEESTETPKAEETASETVEEAVTEEAVTEEAKADDERPEDPWVSSQTEYPQLQVDWTMNEERTNNKTVIYEGRFEEVLLTDESSKSFPELAMAIKNEADTERSDYQKEEEQIIKDAGERFKEQPDFFSSGGYSDNTSAFVRRADDKVVSYTIVYDNYQGGAHGIYGENSISFDVKTGKKLGLSDVLTDVSGLNDLLAEKLKEKYPDDEYFDEMVQNIQNYDAGMTEYDPNSDRYPFNWSMTLEGIRFYFGPYELGPYVAGDKEVTLSYSDIDNIAVSEYLPKEDTRCIYQFTGSMDVFDVTGDGKADEIAISAVNPQEEYNVADGVEVSINGKAGKASSSEEVIYNNGTRLGYYIRTADGRQYIYANAYIEDEYPAFFVFDLKNGEPSYVGEANLEPAYGPSTEGLLESSSCLTDPENMELSKDFQTIATYRGSRSYHVGEDGMPVSDDRYEIKMAVTGAMLTSAQEMKCDIVDEDGKVVSKQETLPVGETFKLLYTDGESWIDAEISDGRIARLNLSDAGDFEYNVNGTPADELFEALPLVG